MKFFSLLAVSALTAVQASASLQERQAQSPEQILTGINTGASALQSAVGDFSNANDFNSLQTAVNGTIDPIASGIQAISAGGNISDITGVQTQLTNLARTLNSTAGTLTQEKQKFVDGGSGTYVRAALNQLVGAVRQLTAAVWSKAPQAAQAQVESTGVGALESLAQALAQYADQPLPNDLTVGGTTIGAGATPRPTATGSGAPSATSSSSAAPRVVVGGMAALVGVAAALVL
jgi:uncharacterized phage infection (PIP) family protein YhgE